ncbi:MAG: ubiquinone-binding protein [Gammaproteobacteria bacterium]|jgi:ribosome-associated toxin RatA of RatAB toxin-antitoxin module|nr:ubiquinone-binding protein [Gammaproteobacteria bacterium]|tara:strand:- start:552 stop:977 length:426 start_codon:yes stop_codon:yes gene_type:complete
MPKINRTAILSVDAIRAFEVVNRVEGYPDFLPGCEKVKILESTAEYSMVKVDVAWAGFSESFVTKTWPTKYESILMEFVEGPFRHLSGKWTFAGIGNDGCKVALDLTYEFDGLASLASPLIKKSIDQIVKAFEREIESEQD